MDNYERDVFKQPITDRGKKSKAGRLKLVYENDAQKGVLITVPASDPRPDQLQWVFRDGALLVDQNFAKVREKSKV